MSSLKLKTRTLFPALVTAESPIIITKDGIEYVFSFDVDALLAMISDNFASAIVDREVTAAGAVTIVPEDRRVRINKTVSEATTLNLTAAADFTGQELIIKDAKGDATNFPISVTPNGAETIDGQSGARLIDWPYGGLRLFRVTGGWLTSP